MRIRSRIAGCLLAALPRPPTPLPLPLPERVALPRNGGAQRQPAVRARPAGVALLKHCCGASGPAAIRCKTRCSPSPRLAAGLEQTQDITGRYSSRDQKAIKIKQVLRHGAREAARRARRHAPAAEKIGPGVGNAGMRRSRGGRGGAPAAATRQQGRGWRAGGAARRTPAAAVRGGALPLRGGRELEVRAGQAYVRMQGEKEGQTITLKT